MLFSAYFDVPRGWAELTVSADPGTDSAFVSRRKPSVLFDSKLQLPTTCPPPHAMGWMIAGEQRLLLQARKLGGGLGQHFPPQAG